MHSRKNKTLIISSDDIHSILRHFGIDQVMDRMIQRLQKAMENYSPEATSIPVRSGFNYLKPEPGLIEWMPLYSHGKQVIIKVVGYHPSNPLEFKLPTILSTVSAYDTFSGHMLSIMDGVLLTALRTGAASAIATRFLAHPASTALGLIGCGAQSVTQLHAISRIFKLEKVLIHDIDGGAMLSFNERCDQINLGEAEIIPSSICDLVENSDIICTCTSVEVGQGPLFSNLNTKQHLHINAVGSDFPGKIEIPLDFLNNSFVCPDFLDQALVEGECQQLQVQNIGPSLHTIVKSPLEYCHIQYERSVFDSTGWALEDWIAMEILQEYAGELGLGTEIKLENISEDAKNPYDFMKLESLQKEF
jgi:L-lysine cyclodeaminase